MGLKLLKLSICECEKMKNFKLIWTLFLVLGLNSACGVENEEMEEELINTAKNGNSSKNNKKVKCNQGEIPKDGKCVPYEGDPCPVANGEGRQKFDYSSNKWGNCLPKKCKVGFHIESEQCLSDKRVCTMANGNPGMQVWQQSRWSNCSDSKCSTGEYLENNQCKKCPPGHKCSDNLKSICPVGRYQANQGKTVCYNCGANEYQDQQGQTSCKTCPSGQTANVAKTACESGGSTGGGNGTLSCPEGDYADAGSCVPCPPGHFCISNKKSLCPSDQYQPNGSSRACMKCPNGKIGSSIRTTCIKTSAGTCQYGYYLSGGTCKICPQGSFCKNDKKKFCDMGKYQEFTGMDFCLKCPNGSYNPYVGKFICLKCPSGEFSANDRKSCVQKSAICKSGEYLIGSSCYSCISGNYCLGSKSNKCKPGTYQDKMGQTSCKPCPDGKYQDYEEMSICFSCPSGETHNPTRTACIKAGGGSTSGGNPASGSCQTGYYKKAGKCTMCKRGHRCVGDQMFICKPGTYQIFSGSTSCDTCPNYEYQPKEGMNFCLDCPLGKTHNSTHTGCQ